MQEVDDKKVKPTCVVTPLVPTANGRRGLTGLENLGNTCFMNAIIQVLVNTTIFRDFFLGAGINDNINPDNPLGSGGRLAIQFTMVVRALWKGSSTYSPSKLKRLIAEKAGQFTGYAQHDAQEFLAFLLDGLHEDLNRVRDKKYKENVSLDGKCDMIAAQMSWEMYKARNDSFIVDTFQGQFRSELTCPVCSKVSVTFDPCMYVSVPIPKKKMRLPIIFFPILGKQPIKMTLNLPKDAGHQAVCQKISKRTGISSHFKFKFMRIDGCSPILISHLPRLETYRFSDDDPLFVFEVETLYSAGEAVVHLYCMQRALPSHDTSNHISECHNCQKPSSNNPVKRCTGCLIVGYCNTKCQTADWSTHKLVCKKAAPKLVGLPFIVSMPKSKLTYRSLASAMESYAHYSVDLFKPPVDAIATAAGDGARTSDKQSVNLFFIKPTDVKGCGMPSNRAERLKDLGDTVLNIASGTYLALDWKNDKKTALVQSKDLEYTVGDDSAKTAGYIDDSDDLTLQKCLHLFTKSETLSAAEAWYCSDCKSHREAVKQMSLWMLPDTLIIQLKRFSFRSVWRDKIEEFISYPVRGLDVTPFYTGPKLSSDPLYDLYGVVNHHGGLFGGHYTAYARCLDKYDSSITETGWRRMDDAHVTYISSEGPVVNKDAYVLFYKRRTRVAANELPDPMTSAEHAALADEDEQIPEPMAHEDLSSGESTENLSAVASVDLVTSETNSLDLATGEANLNVSMSAKRPEARDGGKLIADEELSYATPRADEAFKTSINPQRDSDVQNVPIVLRLSGVEGDVPVGAGVQASTANSEGDHQKKTGYDINGDSSEHPTVKNSPYVIDESYDYERATAKETLKTPLEAGPGYTEMAGTTTETLKTSMKAQFGYTGTTKEALKTSMEDENHHTETAAVTKEVSKTSMDTWCSYTDMDEMD